MDDAQAEQLPTTLKRTTLISPIHALTPIASSHLLYGTANELHLLSLPGVDSIKAEWRILDRERIHRIVLLPQNDHARVHTITHSIVRVAVLGGKKQNLCKSSLAHQTSSKLFHSTIWRPTKRRLIEQTYQYSRNLCYQIGVTMSASSTSVCTFLSSHLTFFDSTHSRPNRLFSLRRTTLSSYTPSRTVSTHEHQLKKLHPTKFLYSGAAHSLVLRMRL